MKQKILIGLSAGALLMMVILTIAPNIDSRSMNTNQFNVAGNRLSIRDGVRLTNQQSGTIKDDAGVTRIILASGAASGLNDGSGASRIEADVGGSVKLKDATANSALEITSIGDAVFSHTAFLDTLLSPDLANTTGFYLSDVTYPGEILFYNNGIPTVSLSRNQSWFNAGSNYFSGVVHVVGKSIFDGTVNSTGSGGSIIDQTASNGVGHVVWKIAHNLPASYTNIFDSTNFTAGWQWFVSSSNANGEIHWTSGPPASATGFPPSTDLNMGGFSLTNGYNNPLVVDRSNSTNTLTNFISTTSLYSYTIPANSLNTNKTLWVHIGAEWLHTTNGANIITNSLFLGGSNLWTATMTASVSGDSHPYIIWADIRLTAQGTSSQVIGGNIVYGARGAAGNGLGTLTSPLVCSAIRSYGVMNTTTNNLLDFQVGCSAGAGESFTRLSVVTTLE